MIAHGITVSRRLGIGLLTLSVLLCVAVGALWVRGLPSDRVSLDLGTGQYAVRVVSSGADREKGLSGTDPLAKTEGMLFVFDGDGRWGIWMKDMRYPIDILWLDQSKTVVDMAGGISPATYPKVFTSKEPARYVLELAAGSIGEASIGIGSRAVFDVKAPGGARL